MPRKKPGKVGENKSQIVREVPLACADEDAAVDFMEARRWGDQPACPHCGSVDVYKMQSRDGGREKHYRWRCRDCGKQYSVRTGTVFEDSRIPMRHWCFAFWAACSSKKGVSAKQIQRQTGLSYKSALFMMHRIRFAMAPDPAPEPRLQGTVEADETYVGGKPRHKGWKHGRHHPRKEWTTKVPVVAMVERGGSVRAEVVAKVTTANLREVLERHVDPSAHLMTDERRGYLPIGRDFAAHSVINHARDEYARGDVTTNTVEGYFGLFKRKLYGTHHAVSKKHLHRYLAEASFIYNTRDMDDGERAETAIRRGQGRRLTYREPTGRIQTTDQQ